MPNQNAIDKVRDSSNVKTNIDYHDPPISSSFRNQPARPQHGKNQSTGSLHHNRALTKETMNNVTETALGLNFEDTGKTHGNEADQTAPHANNSPAQLNAAQVNGTKMAQAMCSPAMSFNSLNENVGKQKAQAELQDSATVISDRQLNIEDQHDPADAPAQQKQNQSGLINTSILSSKISKNKVSPASSAVMNQINKEQS